MAHARAAPHAAWRADPSASSPILIGNPHVLRLGPLLIGAPSGYAQLDGLARLTAPTTSSSSATRFLARDEAQ